MQAWDPGGDCTRGWAGCGPGTRQSAGCRHSWEAGPGTGRSPTAGRSAPREDLWVRAGRILDPEELFFEERRVADERRDCAGRILAPGFIDVQINGAAWPGPGNPGEAL